MPERVFGVPSYRIEQLDTTGLPEDCQERARIKTLLHAYEHGWPDWWKSAQTWCQYILASSFIGISVSASDSTRSLSAWSALLGVFAFSTAIFSLSVISYVEKLQWDVHNAFDVAWNGVEFVSHKSIYVRQSKWCFCCDFEQKRVLVIYAVILVWILTLLAILSLFGSLLLTVLIRVDFKWGDGRGGLLIVCCIIMFFSLTFYSWPVLQQIYFIYKNPTHDRNHDQRSNEVAVVQSNSSFLPTNE